MWILRTDGPNLQQTNEFDYTLHGYPINFVLGYYIAALLKQGCSHYPQKGVASTI